MSEEAQGKATFGLFVGLASILLSIITTVIVGGIWAGGLSTKVDLLMRDREQEAVRWKAHEDRMQKIEMDLQRLSDRIREKLGALPNVPFNSVGGREQP